MNNGVDMLLHKKITALCCIVFLLAGVGGYTADAAINTEVGSLSGMPLPAPKKSETGKKITLNLASRLLTLYEGTEKVRIYPVAVGAPETPSPVGEFSISEKAVSYTHLRAHETACGPIRKRKLLCLPVRQILLGTVGWAFTGITVFMGRTRHGLSAAVYLTAVSVCMKKMWRNFLKVCPWEHPWKSSMTV